MITDSSETQTDIEGLAQRLKLLSNTKRLQLIQLLMEGVHCNCELGDALGISPNLISHHLGLLRKAGLVTVERDAVDGRWIYYSLNQSALQDFIEQVSIFFDPANIKPRLPSCGPQASVHPVKFVTNS